MQSTTTKRKNEIKNIQNNLKKLLTMLIDYDIMFMVKTKRTKIKIQKVLKIIKKFLTKCFKYDIILTVKESKRKNITNKVIRSEIQPCSYEQTVKGGEIKMFH